MNFQEHENTTISCHAEKNGKKNGAYDGWLREMDFGAAATIDDGCF